MANSIMFRGLLVYNDHGYPAIFLPNHPEARSNGSVRIHRLIAHEKFNGIPEKMHVHHVDGDKWNWCLSNIVIISPKEHVRVHNPLGITRVSMDTRSCYICDKEISIKSESRKTQSKVYCSQKCFKKASEKIQWPPVSVLIKLIKNSNFTQVAKLLGVSDNAIRHRLKTHKGV